LVRSVGATSHYDSVVHPIKRWNDSAESKNLSMRGNFNRENAIRLHAGGAKIHSNKSKVIAFKMPSARLARTEAAIDSYLEMPFRLSFPLALCQRKRVKASLSKNVATARINRTECCERYVSFL
jgi:hypothetical protein